MTDEPRNDASGETTGTDTMSVETLQTVVELQRAELSRLLREQSRLNDRIDSLLQLHEREQVLRQQMQASLDRLTAAQIEAAPRPALPQQGETTHESTPEVEDLRARLEHTEGRFSALQTAVGDLVVFIENRFPGDGEANDGFVRVFAPG